MKYKHARTAKRIAMGAIGTLMAMSGATTGAYDGTDTPPLALRKIMQDMDKNMHLMADAISQKDWPLVERIAPLIADHRQPPFVEKMRIVGFVGTSIGKYKAYDGSVVEHAQAVVKAAKSNDVQGIELMFRTLQASCDSCHNEFQKSFVAHFYGKKDAVQ
jgi:cytochrome c556